MKLIAHRGLFEGPDNTKENLPEQINLAIEQGFDVEIDVWVLDNEIYLGHDGPTYRVDLSFLQRPGVWAHAKNLQALELLLDHRVHCFWHEDDERTLTSQGYIWTYPDKGVCAKSVIVVLDKDLELADKNVHAVCGDYVSAWR
jgi:hypothetical protein